MIRIITSKSQSQAKTYFADALSKSDYYLQDQELKGTFHGKLVERLGLNKEATKDDFFKLCENKNPKTGLPLTPRKNEDRIVGWDVNFHCPKSLSVLHFLSKDNHILNAFQSSVNETMLDIEKDAKTRVRKNKIYDDRITGELIWAEFIHQTARPTEGEIPDPHLHSHCFVLNNTYDETEKKMKACKVRDIHIDMPYYQALFHKRLSDKMIELGYQIKATELAFEIEGIPVEVIKQFSKRRDEIGRIAKEKGIHDPKKLNALGAKTRSKKQKGLTMEALKEEWKKQIKEISKTLSIAHNLSPIRFNKPRQINQIKENDCINYAIKDSFERASVMNERKVVAKACRFAIGNSTVSIKNIKKAFEVDERMLSLKQGDRKMFTTKEVLLEEKRMIEIARSGKGSVAPLYNTPPEITLKEEQASAIAHVLTTSDMVSIIKGGAGTGKTTLMEETIKHIKLKGKNVIVVAPTAQASRGVLRKEGYKDADTVAKLLSDKKLQEKLQNHVLYVDEAGLLGTKDMLALLELVKDKKARIILGGDTRQHSSVVRGDALRILNTVGQIHASEVNKIYRQKNEPYRTAVEQLSKGEIKSAFEDFEKMKAIKEVDPLNPYEELVNDYSKTIKRGKTALIISPTHMQAEKVTIRIRDRLKAIGKIGKTDKVATKLVNKNFTEAEKSDWRKYQPGQVIQFNQNVSRIKRGSSWKVKEINSTDIMISDSHDKTVSLAKNLGKHFDVFDKVEMDIAKGDKIRITRNGFDDKKRRLNNGTSLEVVSIDKYGNLILKNGEAGARYKVSKDYGHITHDYCVTSYSSQGKTVDEVFIAQPSSTFAATSMKQFYVSASRGKDKVHIYTDDKAALLEYASEKGDRISAHELILKNRKLTDYVLDQQLSEMEYSIKNKETLKTIFKENLDKDYEPSF